MAERKYVPEPTAQARVTPGYALPCKYVIHTVGPIHQKGTVPDVDTLGRAYVSALEACKEHSIRTVALCCLSTGIFGFPQETAAAVAIDTTRKWLQANDGVLDLVVFNVFLDEDYRIYQALLQEH